MTSVGGSPVAAGMTGTDQGAMDTIPADPAGDARPGCEGGVPLAVPAWRLAEPALWTTRQVGTAWALIVVGWLYRARLYLHDRSLWQDESLLVFKLTHRSAAGLLKPLDINQAAPAGFLLAERAVINTFGSSELDLRLIPFVASLAFAWLLDTTGHGVGAPAGAVPYPNSFPCGQA